MEMPIVDNEFLNLFLPESSNFQMDEIINDFKYYIFRVMSLCLDSLVQEQINNEYECNLARKDFKSFFDERIDNIINIKDLYIHCDEKLSLIRHSLDKSRTIIEESKTDISAEIEHILKKIEMNKEILNNSSLIELFNITTNMISCFKNELLDLYFEYFSYVNSIDSDNAFVSMIKLTAEKINKNVCEIIKRNLQSGIKYSEYYKELFGLLKLENYSFGLKQEEFTNVDFYKKCVFTLYHINLWNCNLDKDAKSILMFLDFVKEKIIRLNQIQEGVNCDRVVQYIFEKYLFNIFKEESFLFQSQEYIFNFISEIKLTDENISSQLSEIMMKHYFTEIEKLFKFTKNSIKKYLSGIKDIKKILLIDTISPLKNDMILIIKFNLTEIYNFSISFPLHNIEDKHKLLELSESSITDTLEAIQYFLDDNFYLLKNEKEEIESNLSIFRVNLIEGVLTEFLRDIYESQGLIRLFSERVSLQKYNQWSIYLQEDELARLVN